MSYYISKSLTDNFLILVKASPFESFNLVLRGIIVSAYFSIVLIKSSTKVLIICFISLKVLYIGYKLLSNLKEED
jgi:hypothetical protein